MRPVVFLPTKSISTRKTLDEADVHLWATKIEGGDESVLDENERQRAANFRFERDRGRFVASHVFLRRVLSYYASEPPEKLDFVRSNRGKPTLARHGDLHFNLSHSGSVAVCAIGRGPLGVDIESFRPIEDAGAIASRFFSALECEEVLALQPPNQIRRFLEIWTRKEAVMKADGIGLAGISDDNIARQWAVTGFELCEETMGAVATAATVERIEALFLRS